MISGKTFINAGLGICLLFMAGCADWQTTPTTVDKHFGKAVKNMVANQTLYPEHSQQLLPEVRSLDGQKGQRALTDYRLPEVNKPNSVSRAKERVPVDIESE